MTTPSVPSPGPAELLEEIRELLAERAALHARTDWNYPAAVDEFNVLQDKLAARVPRLLVAVEAALDEADRATPQVMEMGRVLSWSMDPDRLRERIRRALAGEVSDA